MLLEAKGITKMFGAFKAVDTASVGVNQGEILGLIGPNGAGKSTFFNCLTGDLPPTAGTVTLDGHDITALTPEDRAKLGLARTFQLPQTFESMTVLENVMIGAFLRASDAAEARARAQAVIERVGMGSVAHAPAKSLGTPGRKRLEIARALATEPKVLLLDEPAAGCNAVETQEIDAVISKIAGSGVTVVLVEHDMKLVMKISNRIHVLDQGRTLAQGTAAQVRANPDVVKVYLGAHA
jgi:branched-chain amino acid transport system ATP-binding protein